MEPVVQPVDSAGYSKSNKKSASLSKDSNSTQHAFFLFCGRLFDRPLPRIAFVLLILVILGAFFAPLISPYDPIKPDFSAARQAPSADHVLGTDDIGRDMLSRILVGARVSLMAALIPLSISISHRRTAWLVIRLAQGLDGRYHHALFWMRLWHFPGSFSSSPLPDF